MPAPTIYAIDASAAATAANAMRLENRSAKIPITRIGKRIAP
jgi:hypothetical protein